MINIALFGFVTGLHLALLQFCYFFLLLTNITSTYITYATVVVAWMTGAFIGLIWKNVGAWLALVGGILSYYAIYALVVSNPLSSFTLPLAAIGVAISGLLGGRFFIEMQPLFARADRLFLHENNGFLVGVIAVFLGFTLLGRSFLFWTPLLSGAALLLHLAGLRVRPPSADSNVLAHPAESIISSGPLDGSGEFARRHVIKFASWMIAANLALPLALFIYATTTGAAYWKMFQGEFAVVEWFSSIQMLLIAMVAYANYASIRLVRRLGDADPCSHSWVWMIIALGFVVFSIDERFNLHELLRDDFFEPLGFFTETTFLIPGDIGLYLFFITGVALSWFLLAELRRRPVALGLFIAALTLTLSVVIVDSLSDSVIQRWPAWRFWDYIFEEGGECVAQLLFMLCFLRLLHGRLEMISNKLVRVPPN